MQFKPKTPKGVWALRGVTIAITVIVILVVSTVAYSAYEDYTAVRSELAGGSNQAPVRGVVTGNSENVSINIAVPNHGLYTLNVTMSCSYPTSNIVCTTAHVSVAPGGQGELVLLMRVYDLAQFKALSDHTVNGTVAIAMPPFASVSVRTNFGGFIGAGGGG